MEKIYLQILLQLLNLIIAHGEKLTGYNCITKLPQLTLILLFETSLEYIKTNEKDIRARSRDLII